MNTIHQVETTLHDLSKPKRSMTFWGMLGVMLICAVLVWQKHQGWLRAPNEVMLGDSPDGFKNYMTASWHTRHDESYTHYGGMNYPFGEHVLFTDNQPILSAAIQWWSKTFGDVSGRTVGIMNVFLVVSMTFGCGVLFLLLRRLHLPVWYAGLVALGMTFLSPQYNRFDGHFGLSHVFVFALLLHLLCRYEERVSRRYESLFIAFVVWFSAQLHFYYFGLAALFITLYIAYQVLRDFNRINIARRFYHWLVMLILPFLLLNIWLRWSDFAPDRPANPYGFTVYIGFWEGVFLPYESFPLFKWIDGNIVRIRRINGEAHAYAGLVALGFTLWFLRRRFKIFEPEWDQAAYHRTHKHFLNGIFFAAFILLLFSCGFPFAIKGMEWMVDYMGPLRQFRGLGRFTWAYFYAINVLAFYVLWNRSRRFTGLKDGRYPWLKWGIALIPAGVLMYEAYTFQRVRGIATVPNITRKELYSGSPDYWLNRVDFSGYQALLPLPYYHMGSENIWLDFDARLFSRTQLTAYHTGVPDMGVNMSRTSAGQTVKSVQFAFEPLEMPALLSELPDNRPLAVLLEQHQWDKVKTEYPHIVSKAKHIYDHPDLKILSIHPDSIRQYTRERIQSVEADASARGLYSQGQWRTNRTDAHFHHVSFDSIRQTSRSFQGGGAFTGDMGDTSRLFRKPLAKGMYTLSVWIYANQDLGMSHEMKIVENFVADGKEVHFKHEGLRFHLKAIVNDWALYEFPFEVFENTSQTSVYLHKKGAQQTFFADELMIRPAGFDAFKQIPGWVVRNNYWYRKE